MSHDIVIHGGTVIDRASGLHERRDVAIGGGRITAVEPHIGLGETADAIDATGLYVVPGLVDLHVHVYWGVADLAIRPGPSDLARGATTIVDAGLGGREHVPGLPRVRHRAVRGPHPRVRQHQRDGPDRPVPGREPRPALPHRRPGGRLRARRSRARRRHQGPPQRGADRAERDPGARAGGRGRSGGRGPGHGPHRRLDRDDRRDHVPAPPGRHRHARVHRPAQRDLRRRRARPSRPRSRRAGAASCSTSATAPAPSRSAGPRPRSRRASGPTRSAPTCTASTSTDRSSTS